MTLTIINPDNLVIIDGRGLPIDCSLLMPNSSIRVVQWDGAKGHIEYYNSIDKPYKPNTPLTSINQFQPVIDAWNEKANEIDNASPPLVDPVKMQESIKMFKDFQKGIKPNIPT
jgi:hypothetical protein